MDGQNQRNYIALCHTKNAGGNNNTNRININEKELQSTLIISKSKGFSKILQDLL